MLDSTTHYCHPHLKHILKVKRKKIIKKQNKKHLTFKEYLTCYRYYKKCRHFESQRFIVYSQILNKRSNNNRDYRI